MSQSEPDVFGPIDFVLLEFPQDRLNGDAAHEVAELVDKGIIRLYDVMIISKNHDGTIEALEISDSAVAAAFGELSGARSGLLSDEDLVEAASAMEPGKVSALLVYENVWAVPFVTAARRNGGEVIASARIPAADLMEAVEAMEHTN